MPKSTTGTNACDGEDGLEHGDDEKHTKGCPYEITDQSTIKERRRRWGDGLGEVGGRDETAK